MTVLLRGAVYYNRLDCWPSNLPFCKSADSFLRIPRAASKWDRCITIPSFCRTFAFSSGFFLVPERKSCNK